MATKTQVTLTCQICGFSYERKRSHASRSKYCSRPCLNKSKERQIEQPCARCGKLYSVVPCHKDRLRYCSKTCGDAVRRELMFSRNSDESFRRASREGQARRRVHNGVTMRSQWEVVYARYLDRNNIAWKYEPGTFILPNGRFYIPDFYLTGSNTYVEIKPSWRLEEDLWKIDGFRQLGHILVVLTEKELRDLPGVDGSPAQNLLDREQVLEIVALCKRGLRYSDISKRFGVCRSYISCIANGRSWARLTDGLRPSEQRNKRKLFKTDVEEIRLLLSKGYTQAGVASRFGVSQPLISTIARGLTHREPR